MSQPRDIWQGLSQVLKHQAVDDITKSLTMIKDHISKMYVVQWKTELDHDGKDHKIDIAMEMAGPDGNFAPMGDLVCKK